MELAFPNANAQFSDRLGQLRDILANQYGLNVGIGSGFRDPAEQARLYAQGRTAPGPIVTNAPAGRSYHNYGAATDLKPLNMSEDDAAKAIGAAISGNPNLGLTWGGTFKSLYDPLHVQMSEPISALGYSNGLLPQNAQPTAGQTMPNGILPPTLGQNGGGLLPFGNPIDDNRNAILGYLAGALQGGNVGQSIGRGLGGFLAGGQVDLQEANKLQAEKAFGDAGLSPGMARALAQNPQLFNVYQGLQPQYEFHPGAKDILGQEGAPRIFEKRTGSYGPAVGGGTIAPGGGPGAAVSSAPQTQTQAIGQAAKYPNWESLQDDLKGEEYLAQFPKEVQAAVKDWLTGKTIPTGNPRLGPPQAIKLIGQRYAADMGIPVDESAFAQRKQYQVDLGKTGLASVGGQRQAMKTGIAHLETAARKLEDLGNYDVLGVAPLSQIVNAARGLGTEQAAKINGANEATDLFAKEITKMYAGAPGGQAERDRMAQLFASAKTPQELAAAIESGLELISGRRAAMEAQRDEKLGPNSGIEILNKDDEANIAKIQAIAERLRAGGKTAPATAAPAGSQRQLLPPKAGDVVTHNGIKARFKGGNPADQNNWEVVQ